MHVRRGGVLAEVLIVYPRPVGQSVGQSFLAKHFFSVGPTKACGYAEILSSCVGVLLTIHLSPSPPSLPLSLSLSLSIA